VERELAQARVPGGDGSEDVERRDDVDVRGVQLAGVGDAVDAAEVDELALAPPEPVLAAVEDERVDDADRLAAEPVAQGGEPVAPELGLEDAQVEGRVVRDHRGPGGDGSGELARDL